HELKLLRQMLLKKINAPVTSSAGRIFDAVASIAGVRQITKFEAQGAMELEFSLDGANTDETYAAHLSEGAKQSAIIIDWRPMALCASNEVRRGVLTKSISSKFHNTMVKSVLAVSRRIS